jgi:hypothetical protein
VVTLFFGFFDTTMSATENASATDVGVVSMTTSISPQPHSLTSTLVNNSTENSNLDSVRQTNQQKKKKKKKPQKKNNKTIKSQLFDAFCSTPTGALQQNQIDLLLESIRALVECDASNDPVHALAAVRK